MSPAEELHTAAQTLLDLADETAEEIETNPYWHSEIAERPRWFANGVENGLGGPAGRLAGLLSPEAARALAALLRGVLSSAREAVPAHEECTSWCSPETCDLSAALAVARAINGEQR